MNICFPGRLHIIWSRRQLYFTLWFWGSRYHKSWGGSFLYDLDVIRVGPSKKKR